MPSVTTRISEKSHDLLRSLAKQSGRSMQSVIDEALEEYRRRQFLHRSNAAFPRLRRNRKAWRLEEEERKAWEATLGDGDLKD